MKKIITIVLFAVSISLFANDNPDYKPWNTFNNDSISYLKENFDNSEYYVGKPINELLSDLEIQVKRADFMPNVWGDKKVDFATLYFEADKIVSRAIIIERRGKSLLKLHVSFEPVDAYEYDSYDSSLRKARNNNEVNKDTRWEMFDKAFLGNRIITKISVPDVVR
jgi:hypothetical protein